jgi:hypothetical protein
MNAYQKTFFVTLVCIILLAGCVGSQPEIAVPTPLPPTMAPTLGPQAEGEYAFDRDAGYMEGAQMFDAEAALKHIEYLAGDELQGRLVGTPGNREAGEYIAARFAEYGLQPAGANDGYFQSFTSTVTLNVEQPVLTIIHPAGSSSEEESHTYVTHYEYVPRISLYIGSGDATGRVVWLGKCDPSDFGVNLAEQIVLCAPLSGSEFTQAVEQALQYKVGGLLIIREDDGPYARSGYGFSELIEMPAFRVSYAITEDLLAGSPYALDDLDQLEVPTALATTVHMANAFERKETPARNVLGLLPGTDPPQKDEIVIIGAHYDHVGVDPDGTIYNGANDNASGVAVLLEIARMWQAQGYHPARSVLFAAWDAEEQGMFGAGYYVSAPVYPLEQTVAYINVDCVGVGEVVSIYGQNAMVDQLQASAVTFGFTTDLEPENLADDLPFHDAGIPAAGLMLNPDSSSYYPQLHRPEDDPPIIQINGLRMIGVLSAHALFAWSVGG